MPFARTHVAIVTDSTSDLAPQEADALGIAVVPLTVRFGAQTYRDGVDLTPPQFYHMLAEAPAIPTTQPPSAEDLYATYWHLASQGATAIVSIHVSQRLSETVAVAREAARHIDPRVPVIVIDTQQVSMGLLPAVRFAGQMAQVGAPLGAITAAVRDVLDRTRLYFLVETLEYLQRGGRIGRAQRLLGTLLDAKPLLTIAEGEVAPMETVRPRQRAYERLTELARGLGELSELYVGQTSDELGLETIQRVRSFHAGYLQRSWIGSTVGTHMGVGVSLGAVIRKP